MNGRIIELMNKANKDVGFTFSMEQAKPVHELMEKFAELIVKECTKEIIDMAGKYATFNGDPRATIQHTVISEKLKEHFGVE